MFQKFKSKIRNYFSNGPKAAFVMSLIVMGLLVTIFNMKKDITLVIDGRESKIVTYKGTVQGALSDNKIVLGPKDKVDLGVNEKVKKGDLIHIKRAVDVNVEVDGEILSILTSEDNIESMLSSEGISLEEEDRVSPSLESPIEEGLNVDITRVKTEILAASLPLDFNTTIKKDEKLANTVNKIVQEGAQGEKVVSTKIIYENGKEIDRKVISEVVIKEPIDKVVLQGSLGVLTASRGSAEDVLYKKTIKVRATAYYNSGNNGNHITATGTNTKRNPSGYSSIAVDPRVIPLGTKMYIEGYGYAIAEDTGGAIKGNTIDVFFNSASESYNWGVKYVNVYILN
ncbi:3D/G5 domain-containing protein [Clostridium putrefaciens]|uniref:3D/G5 domain-containing protein n=1 Tax=Clostridium putrefaciens TaxID=99675 RepID=A0A381JAR7_9CLOT|nr:3D domain-containing protein [Clostridium putrefaciens]SUY48360.1 3D/G5 domain-containing protein [Clostridium putrefaciens]